MHVGFVCLAVDREARPVVLDHRVHGRGVMDRSPVVLVVLPSHGFRIVRVPRVWITQDRPLGLLGDSEEEPVRPPLPEGRVGSCQGLCDRHGVEDDKVRDVIRMIQRRSERCIGAPIVAHDREPWMSKSSHQPDHIVRHRSFRRLSVSGLVGRFRGLAVSAKIRAHDRETIREQRCDAMPGRVGARMSVKENHGGTSSAIRTRITTSPRSIRSSRNPSNTEGG